MPAATRQHSENHVWWWPCEEAGPGQPDIFLLPGPPNTTSCVTAQSLLGKADTARWAQHSVYSRFQFGCCRCSVTQSCLTLWPHGQHHTRLPCPSLAPEVCSDSCPSNQWRHLTITSSATPFSFLLLLLLPSIFPNISLDTPLKVLK